MFTSIGATFFPSLGHQNRNSIQARKRKGGGMLLQFYENNQGAM
jgi:hypothetical protein